MSVLDTLTDLAAGTRPTQGLLHNCRFEGFGSESYGIEAIVECFRRAPFALSPDAQPIRTPGHIAVFEGERAIVADLFDDMIGRLWLLGVDRGDPPERRLAVPFDADLDQAGGDVFFAAGDHPELADAAASRIAALGAAITADAAGPRTRAFVVRAFGTAAAGAAQFAVSRLRPDGQDVAGFTLAAARWTDTKVQVVRDGGGEAMLAASRWTPRF